MHIRRCGIATLSIAALVVAGTMQTSRAWAATATNTAALAYVTNGQVAVIEGGSLTVAGTGQNPVWAPNGSALIFNTPDPRSGTAAIYISDQHGANSKVLVKSSYSYINPSWSPDSAYVLYTIIAPKTKPKGQTIQLQVEAVKVSTGAVKSLGAYTFTTGCAVTATALLDTFAHAQGSYHGVPTTLIWAQPNVVVAQSSCSGLGLTLFNVGGKSPKTLSNWSAAVLSPNRKLIAADANGKPGIITVASGATTVLKFKFAPASLTWAITSGLVYAVSQPANSATGNVSIYSFAPNGKTSLLLGTVAAAGAFHLSVNPQGDHLVMAVVARAPAKVAAPPTVTVYDVPALRAGSPLPLIAGMEPAWRP